MFRTSRVLGGGQAGTLAPRGRSCRVRLLSRERRRLTTGRVAAVSHRRGFAWGGGSRAVVKQPEPRLDLFAELEPYRCAGRHATIGGTTGNDRSGKDKEIQ
jgi:hypothetical protein